MLPESPRPRRKCPGLAASLVLALTWAGPAAAQPPPGALPEPLNRVPPDAALFGHLRFAEVWDHPVAKTAREKMPKEVKELVGMVKKGTGIDPADVETLTIYFPNLAGPGDEDAFGLIVTTRAPYDRQAILATAGKGAPKSDNPDLHPINNRSVVHFTGPRTFAVLGRDLAGAYLKGKAHAAKGPLSEAIALAGSGKFTGVGAFNLAKTPRDLLLGMPPPEVRPYVPLFKSRTITGALKAGEEITGEVRFTSEDELNARDSERALQDLVRLAEQQLQEAMKELKEAEGRPLEEAEIALPLMERALETLKTAKVSRQGQTVAVAGKLALDAATVEKLVEGVQRARKAAEVMTSQNNLKQIGLALHNYHDTFDGFPPAAIVDKRGKPLLSWRVAILPYLDQNNLYQQFKLDEPWDSEHNRKLLEKMPRVYFIPGVNKEGDTKTHYQVFTGGGAIFDKVLPTRFQDIQDGSSNTILAVEAAEAVPWTKPDDLEYDPNQPVPKLLLSRRGTFTALLGDGSVRSIKKDVPEKTLRLLITRSDGMPVPNDF